jgi:hypothetical protein
LLLIKSRLVNVNFISCFLIGMGFKLVVNQCCGEYAWLLTDRGEHVGCSAIAVGFDGHDQLPLVGRGVYFNTAQEQQTVLHLLLKFGAGIDQQAGNIHQIELLHWQAE